MASALSEFEAISNFASFDETQFYIENISSLKNLFNPTTLNEYYKSKNCKELFNEISQIKNLDQIIPLILKEINKKNLNLR